MEEAFEQVFKSVNLDNWEEAVTEAEQFIRNVKSNFDELIFYIFFKDGVTAGKTYRYLIYTYSYEVPDVLKNFFRGLANKCPFFSVNELNETDFNESPFFKCDASMIWEDELHYLIKLSQAVDISTFIVDDLEYSILEKSSIVEGLKEFFSNVPINEEECEEQESLTSDEE